MHCEIPSVGAQAFLQLELPAPQSNISIVGITVTLVQTVRVYVDTSAPAVRTEEKQLARFINAATFGTMDSITGKVAYGPRWRPGEPVSLAQSIILPTHEVSMKQVVPALTRHLLTRTRATCADIRSQL